ncbi:MAG: hypothetical protein ACK5MD_07975, partial [Flavobacteriales bacterium]
TFDLSSIITSATYGCGDFITINVTNPTGPVIILCDGITTSGAGNLVSGQTVNVTITVPYTGSNGESYAEKSVGSTGVGGLTATLQAGTLSTTGSGTLRYTVTGKPTSSGTARFNIPNPLDSSQTCPVSFSVDTPIPDSNKVSCNGNANGVQNIPNRNVWISTKDFSAPWGQNVRVTPEGMNNNSYGNITTPQIVVSNGNYNQGVYAAKLCDDLVEGGYDDWYLPSYREFEACKMTWPRRFGLSLGRYWTATDKNGSQALAAGNGASDHIAWDGSNSAWDSAAKYKSTIQRVRCIRLVN